MIPTLISEKVTRPNFFPGQLVDYKDFNRLSQQADKVSSLTFRYLFENGGVVINALKEFNIVPMGGLKFLVQQGLGLAPSGQILVLNEEKIGDLTAERPLRGTDTVVVSIKNSVLGMDRYIDQTDGSVSGFRTETFEPELVFSTEAPPDGALELFRVRLSEKTAELQVAESGEEWSPEMGEGVVDLRSRGRIIPHTYAPHSASELVQTRKALYAIEQAHWNICRLYLIEDPFYTVHFLVQLHAEILARPFQPLKAAFLLSEFAEKLSLFLDRLGTKVGAQRTNFDRETFHQAVALLDSLKAREVLPRSVELSPLLRLSQLLSRFLEFAEKRGSLLSTVEEALLDLQGRKLELDDKLVLAGHLFQRTDYVDADRSESFDVKAKSAFSRLLAARFENGDALSLKGKFVREGVLSVKIAVPHSDRPVVLLLRQYVRRGGSKIHYEFNGKPLVTDEWGDATAQNRWINRGLVVPAESLVPQDNQLVIRVERSDLDFGFFDVGVYQPSVYEGMQS